MNEWEIIGRFVDLDNRLRTLEGRPTVQEKPQPVATLCEDIEILLKYLDDYFSGIALESFKNNVRHALTAERKRRVLVDAALLSAKGVRDALESFGTHSNAFSRATISLFVKLDALDAFDKGAV